MTKLRNEIKVGLDSVRSHTLQPKWYKALKVAPGGLPGWLRLPVWPDKDGGLPGQLSSVEPRRPSDLSRKTQRWQRSWLDFIVAEENGKRVAKSIGKFYYAAVVLNTVLSVIVSQALPLA